LLVFEATVRARGRRLDVMVLFLLLSLPCAKRWMHRESFEFAA